MGHVTVFDLKRFGYPEGHPLLTVGQPPRWKAPNDLDPPLDPIGNIQTPVDHAAMLWPGFAEGKPRGCKAFFPVPSKIIPGKGADELLFVPTKASREEKAADYQHIVNFLTSMTGTPDKYISTHVFYGRRIHQNLRNLTAFTVDLDLSKSVKDFKGDFMAQRQDALFHFYFIDVIICFHQP